MVGLGCSPVTQALDGFSPATISNKAAAKRWAGASAPMVYALSLVNAVAVADGGCPSVSDDGSTMKIAGGCTDPAGVSWSGSVTLIRTAPDAGTGLYTFDGWTRVGSMACPDGGTTPSTSVTQGAFKIAGLPESREFFSDVRTDVTVEDSSCGENAGTTAWSYSGTVSGGLDGAPFTWAGRGRIGNSRDGVVSAETIGEVIDEMVCSTEAASGSTTVRSGSDTVVITYDGASKCDPTSTVTWRLNGAAQGELTGVSCASATEVSALALLLATWRLRRSRSA